MSYLLFFAISVNAWSNFHFDKKSACGLKGTIEARIADCSLQGDALKGNFQLVSRNFEMQEVRLDLLSNLLWGDDLKEPMDHYDAQIQCLAGEQMNNGMNLEWRLPSVEEFRFAAEHNIDSILKEETATYWTSNIVSQIHYRAFAFHLVVEQEKYFSIKDEYRRNQNIHVRCVSHR